MIITEAAQNKVDQVLKGDGFLEVCLEGGGCSGYLIKLKGTSEIPEAVSYTHLTLPTILRV